MQRLRRRSQRYTSGRNRMTIQTTHKYRCDACGRVMDDEPRTQFPKMLVNHRGQRSGGISVSVTVNGDMHLCIGCSGNVMRTVADNIACGHTGTLLDEPFSADRAEEMSE